MMRPQPCGRPRRWPVITEESDKQAAERISRLVSDIIEGGRIKAMPSDAAERDAIQVALRLAAIRNPYPGMSAGFQRRLRVRLEKGEAPSRMNRRSALVAGVGLVAAAGCGALVRTLADPLIDQGISRRASAASPLPAGSPWPAERAHIEPRIELGRWVDTGLKLADLPEGLPRRVVAGAIGAFLVRRGNRVAGMSAYCTHQPCELVWQPERKLLNCPCHGVTFDIDGQPTTGANPWPALPLVRVRVRNDGQVEALGT